jgi:hypothetical protein
VSALVATVKLITRHSQVVLQTNSLSVSSTLTVLINIIEESAGDCQKANEAEMTAKCSLNLLNFVSGKVLTHQNDFSASYRKR